MHIRRIISDESSLRFRLTTCENKKSFSFVFSQLIVWRFGSNPSEVQAAQGTAAGKGWAEGSAACRA